MKTIFVSPGLQLLRRFKLMKSFGGPTTSARSQILRFRSSAVCRSFPADRDRAGFRNVRLKLRTNKAGHPKGFVPEVVRLCKLKCERSRYCGEFRIKERQGLIPARVLVLFIFMFGMPRLPSRRCTRNRVHGCNLSRSKITSITSRVVAGPTEPVKILTG